MKKQRHGLESECYHSFDVDKFISDFESFIDYFKKEVKIINHVGITEIDYNILKFNIDIPSMDLELSLYESRMDSGEWYYSLDLSHGIIDGDFKINKEQHVKLYNLCRNLDYFVHVYKKKYDKASIETFSALLKLAVKEREGE